MWPFGLTLDYSWRFKEFKGCRATEWLGCALCVFARLFATGEDAETQRQRQITGSKIFAFLQD